MSEATVRDLVSHYIGGGWGGEEQVVGTRPVRVIRGADFPEASLGSLAGAPLRYESEKKIPTRTLETGDIILEISGGTKERPTGRTVFASQRLLAQSESPVIPASFCRLVRPNRGLVVPAYLYYWLQDMYAQGRTWKYQVQSTGLANFQMEMFLDAEVVRLPPLQEQRRIASILGALDDLIETERALAEAATALVDAEFDRRFGARPLQVEVAILGHVVDCATTPTR